MNPSIVKTLVGALSDKEPDPRDQTAKESDEVLSALLTSSGARPAPASLRAALMAATEPNPRPIGHARRVAQLFDRSEDECREFIAKAGDPDNWIELFPGFSVIGWPDETEGPRRFLIRFGVGLKYPQHRHGGDEDTYVMVGSFIDANGVRFGPGATCAMKTNQTHQFDVEGDQPCICAVLLKGDTTFLEGDFQLPQIFSPPE